MQVLPTLKIPKFELWMQKGRLLFLFLLFYKFTKIYISPNVLLNYTYDAIIWNDDRVPTAVSPTAFYNDSRDFTHWQVL
jgi:hypothetical protein